MKVSVETFSLPKRGHSQREYEDAAWPPTSLSGEFSSFRLAVADGATESSFSRLWARLLVQAFRRGCFDGRPLAEVLDPLQRRWLKRVKRADMPWYVEQKLNDGAFASLTGLRLTAVGSIGGNWESTAVGDSCLIHLRDAEVIASTPINSSEQFTSRPTLLSTTARLNENMQDHAVLAGGEWLAGDTFYLMSDAIACWFFKRWELQADPIELLNSIRTRDDFCSFTEAQRSDTYTDGTPCLKNDDMTFIRCYMVP